MRILMVNVPFSGHVNPTLLLARKLVERGHSVSYILTNQWKEKIEETGAAFIPLSLLLLTEPSIPFRFLVCFSPVSGNPRA